MKNYYCSLHLTMDMIGNKWKPLILFHLLAGPQRSGALQRSVPEISNKMFTQTIRELERDHLLTRTVHPVVPPHVEYELTDLGRSLEDILKELDNWGKKLMP
ncbi:helix-turn-helix transcriptional regulator [Mucilaginibacter robiniae]|uniref:Helix-turn-helix transcriptional regulator n=1 Tax=Mucilaginibacter robiniae TaxID=2728022 RepID=A0A7L5E3I1_9SPHI|nr:helix-turn-helix domain-containing protein [Mucilaginibacter robiniae]QJD96214.1 helix-turn-helix transcriptional regulator [Mucilaginibacter robiniae]